MTSRTAATRYARALLDVASKEGDLKKVEQELGAFAGLIKDHPSLERVLMNPAVPAPRKRAAVSELTRMSGVSPVVAKLLALLAERDRLLLLNDVVVIYRDLLMERENVIRAEVTTANPLAADQATRIEQQLAAATGKRVTMVTRVDAGIVGGMVARVGSTVYDASVATQLRKIRERLTA